MKIYLETQCTKDARPYYGIMYVIKTTFWP